MLSCVGHGLAMNFGENLPSMGHIVGRSFRFKPCAMIEDGLVDLFV